MAYVHFGAPVPYNGTGVDPETGLDDGTNDFTGGDSNSVNINQWFQSGDVAFIIVASAMVMLMPAGIAFLYSGLSRRKSALSLLWTCVMSYSVISFQWFFWGYSLAFSPSNNGYIGVINKFGFMHSLARPSPGSPFIPDLLYSYYQMQFCAVTAALVVGAVAERGRVLPAMVFCFLWATLVYCPMACWAWNIGGWGFKYGVYDWAGGGPVEIGSGMSALAYSWVLGKRHEKMMINFRPHNISLITLGTIFLYFGWLGFNGGSSFGANLRAIMACWNTTLTAAFAAMAWCLMDFRLAKKWSLVGWCSGTISGLVAATPASGFITPWASVALGVVSGVVCNLATQIKFLVGIDDSLDVFAEHAVGGIVGLIFNALFAEDWVIALDGVNVGFKGGWVNQNWAQLYIQLAYIVAGTAYSFVVSAIIAKVVDVIPGLKLRASEDAELMGMDDDQHGEFAYDYVEVRRDYLAWTPAEKDQKRHDSFAPQHGIPEYAVMASTAPALPDSSGTTETEKAKAAPASQPTAAGTAE